MKPSFKNPVSHPEVMYPTNWQMLSEQHGQDAVFILIDGTITYANKLALDLLKAKSLNEITGMRWNNFVQFSTPNQLKTHLQAGSSLLPCAIAEFCQIKTRDGQLIDAEVRLNSFPVQRNTAYRLKVRDLNNQPIAKSIQFRSGKDTSRFGSANGTNNINGLNNEALHHEKEILEMIALDNPLTQILQDVCDRMERLLDNGSVCAIMLYDQQHQVLKLAAAPSMEAEFLNEIDHLEIGLNMWSCGVAIQTGKIKIVERICDSDLWLKHQQTPTKYGYQSCWSVPIKTAFNVLLGTVDIYHRNPAIPSDDEQTLIMDAMHVIALAIDKKTWNKVWRPAKTAIVLWSIILLKASW